MISKWLVVFLLSSTCSVKQAVGQEIQILDSLTKVYQSCLDEGINMYGCAQAFYSKMDSMLNVVYKKVRRNLDSASKLKLKAEQQKWLSERDKYFKRVDTEGDEDIDCKMIAIDKKSIYVRKRVEFLIKEYQ